MSRHRQSDRHNLNPLTPEQIDEIRPLLHLTSPEPDCVAGLDDVIDRLERLIHYLDPSKWAKIC